MTFVAPLSMADPASQPSLPPLKAGAAQTLLVFDSGLGGLSVYREISALRPDADHVYVADCAAFPYGRLSEKDVIKRVNAVMDHLIPLHTPDCVIIACNTASTLVLPSLRQRFATPFVGTVPAIKPACAQTQSRMISVLATPGTVARDYTRALMAEFGKDCAITLVGATRLANLAESVMRGEAADEAAIAAEIAPCFVTRKDRRTDVVVLACTHYPLILPLLNRLAPWPVTFLDPAPAIARRVMQLAGAAGEARSEALRRAILTKSGLEDSLAPLFRRFGLSDIQVDNIAFSGPH